MGLYELFISKIELPAVGVTVVSLDDLKDKLVGVIIVALAVRFLAQIAAWDGRTDLLSYGISIAPVIPALGAFNFLRRATHGGDHVRGTDEGYGAATRPHEVRLATPVTTAR